MGIKTDFLLQANFAKYCLKNKVRKLQLGCAGNIIKGFFNTDINTAYGAYYLDVRKTFPFCNNSFHYVYSEHNFEHLSYHEGKLLLKECYRVLKPNGVMRLTMPCLEFLIDIYDNRHKQENQDYMEWHFKTFAKEQFEDFGEDFSTAFLFNNFMRLWDHKCVYDKPTIKRMIELAGFKNVTFCRVSESNHEELQNVEHHQYIIPPAFNAMETMCVEAEK